MQKLLKTYQKRLTNLSSRNKSLLLMRTSKNYFFDFESLDFSLNKSAYEILAEVFAGKKAVKICTKLDPRDEKSNILSSSLLQLFRTDQLIQAERGAMDLQLGFPFVKGKFSNENSLRCPLLFLPVRLIRGEKYWELERNGEIQFNTSFLLAYQQFNGIKLSDEFLEEDFQDFSRELDVFVVEFYEFLKNSSLELNFNSELFEKKIRFFEKFNKEDLELLEQGKLKLQAQAILGIFSQAGSYIAQDYNTLLEQNYDENELENIFTQELKAEIKEKDLHLPLEVDASQEEVIKLVNQGASLVVQGPPGSGKSQLIANLMADYAAKGKKVLLVCQKRAALDMVYKRLAEVGMGAFAGLVHDFKSDRKVLFEKIKNQIDSIEEYKKENYDLDAIFLEREFNQTSMQIEKVCNELSVFKSALYDESKFGKSAKELYLIAADSRFDNLPSIDLYREALQFDFDSLEKLKSSFEQINAYQEKLEHATKGFWDKRTNATSWTNATKRELSALISQSFSLKNQVYKFGLNEPKRREGVFELIRNIKNEKVSIVRLFDFKSREQISEFAQALSNYEANENLFLKLAGTTLTQLEQKVDKAISLQNSALKFAWYKSTNRDWKELQTWISGTDLTTFRTLIRDYNNLAVLQQKYDFDSLSLGKEKLKEFETVKKLGEQIKSFGIHEIPVFEEYIQLVESYEANVNSLQSYFNLQDLNLLFSHEEFEVLDFLNSKFDLLVGHDELVGLLSSLEKAVFEKTTDPKVAEFSVIIAFIEYLEEKEPLLKGVSSLKISQFERDLHSLIEKKKTLSQENLLIQLKETTYRYIDKNRLGNTTSYRELRHQVSKKRSIWPIRKVLENFHEELFRLLPCWLASPETVSAVFPMEQYFDLVIFDEASQCFAENGLPAMMRGRQVLVAGDSKQLQPNDLYRVRFEEEESEEYLTEIDSLLSLCSQFLPNHLLKGHYRSKTLELIGFSNKHFYDNKLQLIPHFDEINSPETSIDFIKVEGLWEQQQNIVEAEKIKEIITEIDSSKSIGVVTFNHPQAKLIQDLVDDERVRVKNIENIQGDEFDVLIFSVAYAPDSQGKLRFQFGTLGLAGGENRLNVAVTRAREKVIVVTSLEPEQLQVETATNLGPKLLKEYLAYAKRISAGEKSMTLNVSQKSFALRLSDKLVQEGEGLSTDLPFSDIAQMQEGLYTSLILTDDNLLHQTVSSKEAFGYLPLALKQKAWTVHRSWSRNYWLKR
ncbi:AAA domain-containing protein [Spirosomataceae bacterium TFI 002]|nr:AAA domain-containing protein [Spirosomataceae bacterium TFI 002]